jgi:hypothetical protein
MFSDADPANGALPAMSDIDSEPSVKAAEASSLDEVAFGLAYPDLVWTVAPFLKGLDFNPPSCGTVATSQPINGAGSAWKRTASLARPRFVMARRHRRREAAGGDVQRDGGGNRPAHGARFDHGRKGRAAQSAARFP